MGKVLFQNCRKSGAEQKGVVVSMMDEVFLEILIWGLQYMKRISRSIDIDTLDIDTIDIEWCHNINNQKKLEAAWPNTLS